MYSIKIVWNYLFNWFCTPANNWKTIKKHNSIKVVLFKQRKNVLTIVIWLNEKKDNSIFEKLNNIL